MKRFFPVLLQALAVLGLFSILPAQNFQYPYVENFGTANELQLGAPNPAEGTLILPVGTDLYEGNAPNTIFYGLTPPNSSNRPVMVFVHGYASSASVWYEGKDNMYRDVYDDGYRSAFVTLTPNRHMWTNGNMLSNAIDRIKIHYGVNDVVVVGWSKGGVDTDAAIVHFGANAKVSQAFTLSTPHQGTSIAEAANSILLSLVNVIFMQNNDATKSLTRGYMSYFRSITDGNPGNTVGYTTLGGWGNGPLNRLSIPQGLIHLIDGPKSNGGNDGVVPYASSLRPGGRELFAGQRKERGWFGIPYYPGPSETELDHFEVTRGSKVWPFIKAVMEGNLKTAPQETPLDYRIAPTVHSQQQIVASQGSNDQFFLHAADQGFEIRLFGENLPAFLPLVGSQGSFPLAQITQDGNSALYAATELVEAGTLTPGSYRIDLGESDYVATVEMNSSIAAHLTPVFSAGKQTFTAQSPMSFAVGLSGLEGLDDCSVTGTLHRIHGLEFQAVEDAMEVLSFEKMNGQFRAETASNLPAGIYSITVTVTGPGFSRTLVSSVAKTGSIASEAAQQLEIQAYPNPFSDVIQISMDTDKATSLEIYDLQGRNIQSLSITNGQDQLEWNAKANGFSPGMYILELRSQTAILATKRVVMH